MLQQQKATERARIDTKIELENENKVRVRKWEAQRAELRILNQIVCKLINIKIEQETDAGSCEEADKTEENNTQKRDINGV